MFTDESHVFVQEYKKKTVVWRNQAQPLRNGHLQPRVNIHQKRCFGDVLPIQGLESSFPLKECQIQKYTSITAQRCSNYGEELPISDWIFQHDLATCPTSRKGKEAIEEHKINMLQWPRNSTKFTNFNLSIYFII